MTLSGVVGTLLFKEHQRGHHHAVQKDGGSLPGLA
jgi:hypothetical protein